MCPILIEQTEPRRVDMKYVALMVGVLLIALAVITQMYIFEHRRRIDAQWQLGEVQMKLEIRQAEGWPPSFQREDVPTVQGLLDGEPVNVVRVTPWAARRMGLRPGEVIAVGGPPAASEPAAPAVAPQTQTSKP